MDNYNCEMDPNWQQTNQRVQKKIVKLCKIYSKVEVMDVVYEISDSYDLKDVP